MPSVIGIRFGLGTVNSTRSVGGRPVRFLPFHCRDRQLGQMLGGFFETVCQEYPQRPQVHCLISQVRISIIGLHRHKCYCRLASLF
jgi:hypothetical protein